MKKLFLLFFIFMIPAIKSANGFDAADSTISYRQFIKQDSVLSFCSGKGYVPSLFHDFGAQFISPVKMKGKDWVWVAVIASVTAAFIYYDYEIDEKVRYAKDKSEFVRVTSPVVTEFGNTYGLGLVGVCGVIGLAGKNRKLFQTSLLASQAAITSGISRL